MRLDGNVDNGFAKAQAAYERMMPDDDDDNICPDCDGIGCTHSDPARDIVAEICSTCKGHGTLDGVRADAELERQIEQQESRRESSEGCEQ